MPVSWSPFAVRQRLLVTELTPQQCYERLQLKVRSTREQIGQARGVVSTEGFSIRPDPGPIRNFQIVANGAFTAIPTGTQIKVRLSLDSSTSDFALLWFGGVLLFLCGGLIQLIPPHSQGQQPEWAFIYGPAGMLLLGCVFFNVFRLALEAPLLQFLKETLQAEDASRILPASSPSSTEPSWRTRR